MKKLIYSFLPFCLWLLSISTPAQYVKIIRDTACGLYKGEILVASDSLYNKEGKLATPKYGKIRVLEFTEAYDVNALKNKMSNFQKDSLYDILQDAADLSAVHFKGADGADRYDVKGLKIEKVQTGYMADSGQLCYKAYLSNDMCLFVSTKDAEKYTEAAIANRTEAVLDKSYREENDVYIVCEYNGRVVVEGIAEPFIIKAGEETNLADVSGKKMRFIFDGGLSFVISFEQFEPRDESTIQEKIVCVLNFILLLLFLCLIWKYKKLLFSWPKRIRNKGDNSVETIPSLTTPKSKFGQEENWLLDQSITKIIEAMSALIDKKMTLSSDAPSVEGSIATIKSDLTEVKQVLASLIAGNEMSSNFAEPEKDLNIEELRKFIEAKIEDKNSAITQSINEIKVSINDSITPTLTSLVNREEPLSLDELQRNFNIADLKLLIENNIKENSVVAQSVIDEVSGRNDEEKQIQKNRMDELIKDKEGLIKDKEELIKAKEELIKDIDVLRKQEPNSSNFIQNGVKVEGCNSFVGFTDDFLSTCQNAEKDIYFRMKKMSVDEKVKVEPIFSEYYQTRPTLMIEKWKGILATLKMCGHVSDAFVEVKNSEEREKFMQECFFKEVVRPYVSALLICLERFRTGEYINLRLDDSFVRALSDDIEEIIQVCRINEIEVIYQRLFEELNLAGEQFKSYEIIYQKSGDKHLNLLTAKVRGKKNLLLSVSEYAVNSITTKWGYSRPEKTKCTVLDV